MLSTLGIDNFPREQLTAYGEVIALVGANPAAMEDPLGKTTANVRAQTYKECIAHWLRGDVERRRQIYDMYVVRVALAIGEDDSYSIVSDVVAAAFTDPTEEVRKSFTALLQNIARGVSLIPSEQVRALATRAATNRNDKVDVRAWAKRLVDDTRGADD